MFLIVFPSAPSHLVNPQTIMLITPFDIYIYIYSRNLERRIAFLGKSCPVSFRANSMLRWNSAKILDISIGPPIHCCSFSWTSRGRGRIQGRTCPRILKSQRIPEVKDVPVIRSNDSRRKQRYRPCITMRSTRIFGEWEALYDLHDNTFDNTFRL